MSATILSATIDLIPRPSPVSTAKQRTSDTLERIDFASAGAVRTHFGKRPRMSGQPKRAPAKRKAR